MKGMYEKDQPLKVQEVGDTIFAVESHETPMGRLIPRGSRPAGTLSSWPVQEYPRRPFGGTFDGYDVDKYNSTTREPLKVYAQWLLESWLVSKLAELTQTHGVRPKTEKAKQAADALLLLKKKVERLLLSFQDTAPETGVKTPFLSRGMLRWLDNTAQGVEPVPAAFRPPAACVHKTELSNLTAAAFEDMVSAAAEQKMSPVDLFGVCGIKLKRQMSDWTQRGDTDNDILPLQRFNLNAADKKLIRGVDRFEFDAGTVETALSWYIACDPATGKDTAYTPRSGLFVDLSMWELRYLQPIQSVVEPPKSGGPRGYHDTVLTIEAKNPLGQLLVYTNQD